MDSALYDYSLLSYLLTQACEFVERRWLTSVMLKYHWNRVRSTWVVIDKLKLLTILCRIYRVGHKSKRLILSECVSKTEKIGGMWTNTNIYRENGALSDIFTWNIYVTIVLCLNIFYDWKQSMKLLLRYDTIRPTLYNYCGLWQTNASMFNVATIDMPYSDFFSFQCLGQSSRGK